MKPESFIWATDEKARLRALSLVLIRGIVEKYGGTIEHEIESGFISIDVPKEHEVACAREIEEAVGGLSCPPA